jgi:hypothetical protein
LWNGSYIVSYFVVDDNEDDDNDDSVKANMIPVITGVTGTISRSSRKYLSNIPGKDVWKIK